MSQFIDEFVFHLEEEFRYNYFLLHDFILSVSPLIVSEKKFNSPFYTCNGLLLYINFDKKIRQLYLGFCLGSKLNDHNGFLDSSKTNTISKWYFKDLKTFSENESLLRKFILESIELNLTKKKK